MTNLYDFLEEQFPSLPPLTQAQEDFLLWFRTASPGRSLRLILDCSTGQALPPPGEEILHGDFMGMIEEPYRAVTGHVLEEFVHLFHSHNLARHGTELRLEMSVPVRAADGKLYFTTLWFWPVRHDASSSLVAIAIECHFHTPWTINSHPIPFKPMLFVDKEPLEGLEKELGKNAMLYLPFDLKIKSEWMSVLLCHYQGVENKKISGKTGLEDTTVNFYNTKILNAFRRFSSSFQKAWAAVDFLKAQGWVLLPQP